MTRQEADMGCPGSPQGPVGFLRVFISSHLTATPSPLPFLPLNPLFPFLELHRT